jgi:hypothetical protein
VNGVGRRRQAARNACTTGADLPPAGLASPRLGNAAGFERRGHDSIASVGHASRLALPRPRRALTTDAARARAGALADLVAPIERAAVDLALGEEPAGFVAALDAGAPPGEPAAPPAPPRRD